MMRGSCDNWATSEETRRPRAGIRAAYVPLQGDEPHRRGLHAPLWPRIAPRPRGAPPALSDARRAARLSSAAPGLERLGRAFESHHRRMGRCFATARWAWAHVRLLSE